MTKVNNLVPARYVGHHPINLVAGLYFNVDGTRRTSLAVSTGDEMMMPEREILGQTYLFDPTGNAPPLDLGVGRRVLPEHVGLSDESLALLGYEFHVGRSDWVPITAQSAQAPAPIVEAEPLATPAPEPVVESPAMQVVRGG